MFVEYKVNFQGNYILLCNDHFLEHLIDEEDRSMTPSLSSSKGNKQTDRNAGSKADRQKGR